MRTTECQDFPDIGWLGFMPSPAAGPKAEKVVTNVALVKARIAPRRTIRFWLNCLVFACIFPAVVGTTYIIVHSFNQGRAGLERDTIATARALSQVVDAELKGARSALLVLAESPYLVSGDLAKFYDHARELVSSLSIDNIVLTDISGQQLINTKLSAGRSSASRRRFLSAASSAIHLGFPFSLNG